MSLLRPVPSPATDAVTHVTPAGATPALRLGFLSPHNPFDATAFSGTVARAFAALDSQPHIDLRLLGPHRPASAIARITRRGAARAPARAFDLSPAALRGLDAIVGLVASELLDHLPPGAPPILHVTDATPKVLARDYGRDISATIFARETRVAARADRVIYSSAAMACRAAVDLGLPDLHPLALPFGLNIDAPAIVDKTPPRPRLELLFVGLDWMRKGGDIAVDALRHLRASGQNVRLTLVGRVPPGLVRGSGLEIAGFLDKNRAKDAARLSALYARAHLLILPTRGDCTPMVLGEAMAHGTPVLASDIGGIAEGIGAGGAGDVMPTGATSRDWARRIDEMTCDPAAWAFLSDAARDRAAARFSWQAWAQGIATAAKDAVGHSALGRAM